MPLPNNLKDLLRRSLPKTDWSRSYIRITAPALPLERYFRTIRRPGATFLDATELVQLEPEPAEPSPLAYVGSLGSLLDFATGRLGDDDLRRQALHAWLRGVRSTAFVLLVGETGGGTARAVAMTS